MLQAYLDWQRSTLLCKCAGLTSEQLVSKPISPSQMSLLGLVRHLTEVERIWWRQRFQGEDVSLPYRGNGNKEAAFEEVDPATAEADIATLRAEWQACDEAVALAGLDDTFYFAPDDDNMSLRCIYLHLIEEYARHNGHADMLREQIDGSTGE